MNHFRFTSLIQNRSSEVIIADDNNTACLDTSIAIDLAKLSLKSKQKKLKR